MFQIFTLIIALASFILSFIYHPAWAWIPLALIDLFLTIQYLAVKQKYKFNYIEELSSEANTLLQRYGHYFAMPFASKDFSASSATSQFAGIILVVICLFKGFWWAIGLGVINWFAMGAISISLSPVSLIAQNTELQIAHDEVLDYINLQNEETINT